MLELLRVKNVALIEETEIEFGEALNVLSGETGAGKSVIIDSLGFVLGGRISRDFIRSGETAALVEALFYADSEETAEALRQLGIEPDAGNALLLSRTMTSEGRGASRVNGRAVTTGMLKEISASLMDIHGQHEHQSLLDPSRHITLLDRFCGGEMPALKQRLAELYKSYRETLKASAQISQSPEETKAKLELYNHTISEIEAANLRPSEEDELMELRRRASNAEKLTELSHGIVELLYDGEGSATEKLSAVRGLMGELASLDGSKTVAEAEAALDGICAGLEDITREFRRYADMLLPDGDEHGLTADRIEERLNIIYRLKRKYGGDVSFILTYCDETREKLERLQNSGEELERLRVAAERIKTEAFAVCGEISAIRRAAAERLKGQVENALKDLGMKDAVFSIEITRKDGFGPDGYDKAEFMISPNLGEEIKELAKIASGGEMSRVMLALKTALADFDCIGTFVFDEIDAGVSGRTAQMVAEKLALLAKNRQILCVTHLPQIAAMGDKNFLIEKNVSGGRTVTDVKPLDGEGVTLELARLTGGAEITEATLAAAGEMKRMADEIKKRR